MFKMIRNFLIEARRRSASTALSIGGVTMSKEFLIILNIIILLKHALRLGGL